MLVIFIVLIFFIILSQKTNLNHIKTYVKIKIFVILLFLLRTLKYYTKIDINHYQKSDKALFIIYADFESLIENIAEWKNNSEKLSATKVGEHIPPGL